MPAGQGTTKRIAALLARCAAASIVVCCATGLQCQQAVPEPLPVEGVTLRIENQSALDVGVEVVYLEGDSLVRRTERSLAASGVEAAEEIIPTAADTVIAAAWIADTATPPQGFAAGEIIQTGVFQRGVDYQATGTISFIIAAPGPSGEPVPSCPGCPLFGDLNDDQIVDALDIPLFIDVLFGRNQDPAAIRKSDFTLDGVIDGRDIQGFVACLAGR